MLPPPLSSCAGWWFAQLWRALLAQRPDRHSIWLIDYPAVSKVRLRPYSGHEPRIEVVTGTLQEERDRHAVVAWEWPGEDGMLHTLQAAWQLGEVVVRPLDWIRSRQPFPILMSRAGQAPWPLHVCIHVHGWHDQLLERADLEALDGTTSYPIRWEPPLGEPRLPTTELPCTITSYGRRTGEGLPALILAGLTLPWRIDLDRDAWNIWRRLSAGDLLRLLGGPGGACPRHGNLCPWPYTGRDSKAG